MRLANFAPVVLLSMFVAAGCVNPEQQQQTGTAAGTAADCIWL